MDMRVGKSKDGTSRIEYHPEPGDLPVSGTSSNGTRTTFRTNGGHQYTARNIHEDEAFWLSAILLCISAACVAWIVLAAAVERTSAGPLFLLGLFGVALLGKSMQEETFAWKEALFIGSIVAVLGNTGKTEASWFAIGVCGFLLIRYAWLWKERAVWEPFAFLALFCAALLAHGTGLLPEPLAIIVFMAIMVFSLVGSVAICIDGWTYTRGLNSIHE